MVLYALFCLLVIFEIKRYLKVNKQTNKKTNKKLEIIPEKIIQKAVQWHKSDRNTKEPLRDIDKRQRTQIEKKNEQPSHWVPEG